MLELGNQDGEVVKIRISANANSAQRGRISIVDPDHRIVLRLEQSEFRLGDPDLKLWVKVKPEYGNVHQKIKPLKFRATLDGYIEGTKDLDTWLAGPNRVELVVHQAKRLQESLVNKRDGIQLQTFPNRITPFQFSAHNLSSKEKTIVATLYQVPLKLSSNLAPGRLFTRRGQVLTRVQEVTTDGSKVQDGLNKIATSKPLTITAGAENMTLDFSPAPPQPPDEGDKKPEAANPADARPAGETKIDVSQGILCEIKEQAPGDGVWLSWIELWTLPPRDYVAATAMYDQRKLSLRCELKPEFELPGLPKKPIPIEWDFTRLQPDVIPPDGELHQYRYGRKPSDSRRFDSRRNRSYRK